MIDFATLQTELTSRGIVLSLNEQNKLDYKAPVGVLTPELTEQIRLHKQEILQHLLTQADTQEETSENGYHPVPAVAPVPVLAGVPAVCPECNGHDFKRNMAGTRWLCMDCSYSYPVYPERSADDFYMTVENMTPPLVCRGKNCHNTQVEKWKLNRLRNRWECTVCGTLGMHNYVYVAVAATGEDAVTEAVQFKSELASQACYVRYYENGECSLMVPAEMDNEQFSKLAAEISLRAEILQRLIPVTPGIPEPGVPEQAAEDEEEEPETEPLPAIADADTDADISDSESPSGVTSVQQKGKGHMFDKVLKRKPIFVMRQDPAYWCDPFTGDCALPDGTRCQIAEPEHVTDILNWITSLSTATRVLLYLVSGTILDERPGIEFFDAQGNEWERSTFSWEKLDGTYHLGERSIRVIGTGEYFGYDPDNSVTDLREARSTLESLIEETFGDVCNNGRVKGDFQFHLHYTPSSTGRELLAGSLPYGQEYPVLSEDVTSWIVEHIGQSRIETFAPAIPVVESGPYVLDARWMYAACVSDLPLGNPLHDTENKRLLKVSSAGHVYPAVPGFYRVEVKVPDTWHHIGLVKDTLLSEEIGHSVYPSDPGTLFEACVTADELAMLTEQGWKYRILERLLFPDTDKYKQPFERWNERLILMREQAEHSQYASLLKNAIRAIHLHTIGSLWRGYDYIYHETPFDALPLPDSVVIAPYSDFEDYEREVYCWDERVPLSPKRRIFYHPEWPGVTWGKARRKLTEFALKLPYESIVYLNTDGVWTTEYPAWVESLDTGKPGSFRLKDHIPGPWPWPDGSQTMRASVLDYNEQRRLQRG